MIGFRGVYAYSTRERSLDDEWAPYGGRTTYPDASTQEWSIESWTPEWSQLKVLSASRWLYATTSADSSRAFGGGRYVSTDTSMTVWRDHNRNPEMIGTSNTWGCRVEGDIWYHTAPPNPELDPPRTSTQVWRKID